jgi:predicted enzyme related to lactoylglutathione lyase
METSEKTFRVTGMDMTGYMVKDTERAIGFYRDVLGLEPATLYPDGTGAEYELADGTSFELYNGGGHYPFRPGGTVAFAVDDWRAAVAHAKTAGGTIRLETETPVCFMALLEDSEGNALMIHKRKNV